mmetsp:Transcript_3647/g.4314  ORF Transcript_3647/g.4314 Transcript_3647/m.4314 type:complete len:131 (+) Transcript_3647:660-1052(+)
MVIDNYRRPFMETVKGSSGLAHWLRIRLQKCDYLFVNLSAPMKTCNGSCEKLLPLAWKKLGLDFLTKYKEQTINIDTTEFCTYVQLSEIRRLVIWLRYRPKPCNESLANSEQQVVDRSNWVNLSNSEQLV